MQKLAMKHCQCTVECPLIYERVQTCKEQLALERQIGATQATSPAALPWIHDR